jgi:hypothetical protein
MVDSEWGQSANNRREVLHLTARRRKQLQNEAGKWKRLVEAIARVMETA